MKCVIVTPSKIKDQRVFSREKLANCDCCIAIKDLEAMSGYCVVSTEIWGWLGFPSTATFTDLMSRLKTSSDSSLFGHLDRSQRRVHARETCMVR